MWWCALLPVCPGLSSHLSVSELKRMLSPYLDYYVLDVLNPPAGSGTPTAGASTPSSAPRQAAQYADAVAVLKSEGRKAGLLSRAL